VLSLSAEAGLFWEDVWKDSANAALASKRKHPTILMPGDAVQLPDLTEGQIDGGTENQHKFSLKGTPARLRLQLRINGAAVSEKDVKLVVDGVPTTATTDRDGRCEVLIPPNAKEAKLRVGEDKGEYLLKLGWLTPIDSTSGLQARLFNLGFNPKAIDNDFGSNTRKAMQAFQTAMGMKPTQKPDAETRDALEKEYGC